jgi:multicomponent Na+:H+ antiporter subunit C
MTMEQLFGILVSKINYWIYILLMGLGLYAMIAKKNLVKKIIGMNILQTAVILFFVSIGAKRDATIPIIEVHGPTPPGGTVSAAAFINPLPHVLMLTAIVVAVATLGVALALIIKLYDHYRTLDEDEILACWGEEDDNAAPGAANPTPGAFP